MTLAFVDPAEQATTFRVCLWAAPGEGKSVAAASAPGPILVVSADRPSAYVFARRHFEGKDIRETRYLDQSTFEMVSKYLQTEEGLQVRTVVLDPVSNVYDHLVDSAPKRQDGEPDYVVVNKKLEQPVSANASISTATADRASEIDLMDFTGNRYLLCVYWEV